MKVHVHQTWNDFSGAVLIDNLGLPPRRAEELQGLGYTVPVSVMSQRGLVEELVLLLYEQRVFEERGTIVLPGRGGQRVWHEFAEVVSELELSLQNWDAIEITATRVLQDRGPIVTVGDLGEQAVPTDSEWVAIFDDVVSSGVTIQGVRERILQLTKIPCKVIAPVINLGRNNPTTLGFHEVFAGLAVRGCKGRDRVPIASLLGFVERKGWAGRFGQKYARDPQKFEAFWE